MKKAWRLMGIIGFWLSWPLLWIYLSGTERTRVIIVSQDNKVLLLKSWLGPGNWILPGGGIHRGEKPLPAAVREVREETGLDLDPVSFKAMGRVPARENGFRYHCQIFVVDLDNEPIVKGRKLEVLELAWVQPEKLQGLSSLTEQLLGNWS